MTHTDTDRFDGASTADAVRERTAPALCKQSALTDTPTARTPLPKSYLQQPPHLRGAIPVLAKADVESHMCQPALDGDITTPPMPLPDGLHSAAHAPRRKSVFASWLPA